MVVVSQVVLLAAAALEVPAVVVPQVVLLAAVALEVASGASRAAVLVEVQVEVEHPMPVLVAVQELVQWVPRQELLAVVLVSRPVLSVVAIVLRPAQLAANYLGVVNQAEL